MLRLAVIILTALCLITACQRQVRMAHPENPQGQYREHIAAAAKLLRQKEDWADRAEWEVIRTPQGWEVIAWRVEHPAAKGPHRYLPWGYSVIELDSRLVTVGYRRKG